MKDSRADSSTYVSPRISVTCWSPLGDHKRENALFTLLFCNGTVVVHWWDTKSGLWDVGYPGLAKTKNVAALAVTGAMRAYWVLQSGKLEEYRTNPDQPDIWYVDDVPRLFVCFNSDLFIPTGISLQRFPFPLPAHSVVSV